MNKILNKKSISIIIAVFLIILLHYMGVLSMLENYIAAVFRPAERVAVQSGEQLQIFYDRTTDKRDLYSINKTLEEYIRELLQENASLKMLADENRALRAQLGFYSEQSYEKVLANVINHGGALDVNRIITIDKGGNDGIQAGQAVVVDEGIIIGKVFKITDTSAHVLLLTDEQSQIAAVIAGKEESTGLLSGELGLTARMDFIPQTAELAVNDLVVSSGLEVAVPKGLLIGRIQEIQKKNSGLFQAAVIEPAINLNNINIVSVILF